MTARSLTEAFSEDHRAMTQAFLRLQRALEANDVAAAVAAAGDINRIAGPHIEFEETCLYPEVRRQRGAAFAARLYSEHDIALEAVRFLASRAPNQPLSEVDRQRLRDQVQTAMDHAATCGTLASHLAAFDTDRQTEFLARLKDCRRRASLWTDLVRQPESG